MQSTRTVDPDQQPDHLRLGRYLGLTAIAIYVGLLIGATLTVIIPDASDFIMQSKIPLSGFAVLFQGLFFIAGRFFARRNQIKRSIYLMIIGCTVLPMIITFFNPIEWPLSVLYVFLMLIIAVQFVNSHHLKQISIVAWISVIIVTFLGFIFNDQYNYPKINVLLIMITSGTPIVTMIISLLFSFHRRLNLTVREVKRINYSLEESRASLEQQVGQRTEQLQHTLIELQQRNQEQAAYVAQIEQQRQTIRELSVPVLPVSGDTLVLPIVGTLDSERLRDLQVIALGEIQQRRAQRLLLDVTGLSWFDNDVATGLLRLVDSAQLLGAKVALIGVRPEVAQALVNLGIVFEHVAIYRDLQSAMH
ncbi:STAS domain-containing protein [Herpetosiphon sp. NSE202]|uniref:STAS domain-containing protein n=1 Tax=Herpetosiphon sp. NSE202 TaxID=3351349 RepID=UPI003631794F